MSNIVTATFMHDGSGISTYARTDALWQYDYGLVLKMENIELPSLYEVHFGNADKGYSKTVLGDENGVSIPDEYLLSGKPVYAWVYLHTGDSDGETEYSVTMPVNKRAQPTNETPTQVQQSVISQAIAALTHAVEECEGCVEHYPKIVDNYWYVWDAETNDFVSTGIDARGLKGDTGAVYYPDVSVNGIISWTNNGDLPNPPPVDLTQAIHLDDYALKSEVAAVQADVDRKVDSSEKGEANGVAQLDGDGKVLSSQLPSYVDDVVEYSSVSQFPRVGESGKIYVSTSNNGTYRWSGTTYVPIGSSLSLGETPSTAYRGDRGKYAYDHAYAKGSQFAMGFNKFATNAEGHVTSVSAVTAGDIEALGFAKTSDVPNISVRDDNVIRSGNSSWYAPIYMNKMISSTSFSFTVPIGETFEIPMAGIDIDVRVLQNYTDGTAAKAHYSAEFLYKDGLYTLNASDSTLTGTMTTMSVEHAQNVITVSFATSLESNYGMARIILYPRTE